MDDNTKYVPCAGFVVLNSDSTQVVLVETHQGNLSFPKGKRHKDETDMQTALRELNEETGLTESDFEIIREDYIDEVSDRKSVV